MTFEINDVAKIALYRSRAENLRAAAENLKGDHRACALDLAEGYERMVRSLMQLQRSRELLMDPPKTYWRAQP